MGNRLLRGLVLCGLLAGGWASGASDASATAVVHAALSLESDAPSFAPAPGATTRMVSLPDAWARSRPEASGPVWYRIGFAIPGSGPSMVLAASADRVCGEVEVQLNGAVVHVSGSMKPPMAPICNDGLLVTLPPALLRPGTNQLDIKLAGRTLDQVASAQRAASLSKLRIGPLSELAPRLSQVRHWTSGVAQGVSLALVVLGLFLMVQGLRHRNDSYLGYFGALSIGLAALTAPHWLPDAFWHGLALEIGLTLAWPLSTWGAVQFLLRHAGRRERLADLVLPAQCLLMPLSMLALGANQVHACAQFWGTLFVIEIAVAATLHLGAQWRASPRSFWMMSGLLAAVAAAELLAHGAQLAQMDRLALGALQVLPALALLLGLRLVQQRSRALESAEASRAVLEQRVAEVKAEIEANYRQLSELRVVQVTDRERKRIAADLHDDLGAKLLTIVHTSESERISTLAREALEEMRLSVRGLTGKPVRLEDALGDWRAEVISRLGQAGIEAVWNMPADDLPQTLPARAFVQTTRIIREAVNNIIKHSGASQCAVRSQVADGDFQLVIQDNGKGIAVEVDGRLDRGHGLSTMKGRAKQLQGQCLVESGPGYGTVIRLTIPLEPAGQPA